VFLLRMRPATDIKAPPAGRENLPIDLCPPLARLGITTADLGILGERILRLTEEYRVLGDV
jgi:hypothetical protein